MTEVTARTEQPVSSPAQSEATASSKSAPTLITEQQVLFGTGAAVALPQEKNRRFSDAVHAVVGSVRTWLVRAAQRPQHYPKRHVWLEDSLMSREMDRM